MLELLSINMLKAQILLSVCFWSACAYTAELHDIIARGPSAVIRSICPLSRISQKLLPALLRYICLQKLSDLDFHILWPLTHLTIKSDGAVELPYDFLLVFNSNSNMQPDSAPLRNTSLQDMGILEFDLSVTNLMAQLTPHITVQRHH